MAVNVGGSLCEEKENALLGPPSAERRSEAVCWKEDGLTQC